MPIWYVVDRPFTGGAAELNDNAAYLASLPIKGATIPIDEDTVVWPKAFGQPAVQARPGKPKLGQAYIGAVPPPKT